MKLFVSLFLLLIFGSLVVRGQITEENEFNRLYQNSSLRSVLNDICTHYDLRLFISHDDKADQPINKSIIGSDLELTLQNALADTGLGFLIYEGHSVIIGDNSIITKSFSSNLYKMLEARLKNETKSASETRETELVIGTIGAASGNGQVTISGKVLDEETNEPVIGATLYFSELEKGASTDVNGDFRITVPVGTYSLDLNFVGYDPVTSLISAFSDGSINLMLSKEAITLDEIVVQSVSEDRNVSEVRSGVELLSAKSIQELPAFMGEADVIKSLLFLPGVTNIGEGASGFNVRGGNVDQNLILQDEAFLFNASHALGFFSTFNTDLINGVTLYKGAMPAQYGGRLSSVLDVEMRDGNYEDYKVKGGVGVVSGRLSVEGPISKNKSSFLVGARMTYSDWILNYIDVEEVRQSSNSFYDINARISQNIGERTKLVLSGYSSNDQLTFSDQFGYDYSTDFVQANLRNLFGDATTSSFTAVYNRYESNLINPDFNEGFSINNGITYLKLKEVLRYNYSDEINLGFGGSFINYELNPGSLTPSESNQSQLESTLAAQFAREFNLFSDLEWKIGSNLALNTGLRATRFENTGPATVNEYENNLQPTEDGVIGEETYSKGEVIAVYHSLEPRISLRIILNTTSSLKLGYNRSTQFLHQISNTAAATPIDIWQFSNKFLQPQKAHNFSVGLFKNWKENTWESSFEMYYRDIDQLVEYKDFAQLLVNENLERELLRGIGRAYGAEFSLRKKIGGFTGWLSYTYSRTERRTPNENPELRVSNGNWYPSNYDKPHDLSITTNIDINKRHGFSFNFTYSTGRPTSGPIGKYNIGNAINIPIYSDRNALRIPDYQRLDFAYNLRPGLKKNKKWKGSWTFSVYNLLSRKNAYSVYYTQSPSGEVTANKLSIIGTAFPALTYNFSLN